MDKKQEELIKHLAIKHELTEEEVKDIIESPFIFIRKSIGSLELRGDETEEEFNNKTKNYNIPCIGKMHSIYSKFKKINDAKRKKRRSDG